MVHRAPLSSSPTSSIVFNEPAAGSHLGPNRCYYGNRVTSSVTKKSSEITLPQFIEKIPDQIHLRKALSIAAGSQDDPVMKLFQYVYSSWRREKGRDTMRDARLI